MAKIVALGEILIDFTPNGINEQGMQLFARNPGGAPANVLAMNAKLGATSAFIGKVGGDQFGQFLIQTLEECGVCTDGVVEDNACPTSLAFVHLDEQGDRSFSFYRNPGADTLLSFSEVNTALIDDCSIFHFGSVSLTDDPCRTATFRAVEYAKSRGKLISFDPNYRPFLWKNPAEARSLMLQGAAMTDILKVSDEEMVLLTGETSVLTGAEKLLSMGPSLVLVSMGAAGAYYLNPVCSGHLPAYAVNTIDTTGAGDAFVGAVLYHLSDKTVEEIQQMSNNELAKIVRFANAAGSLTTTKSGAIPALPKLSDIECCISSDIAD